MSLAGPWAKLRRGANLHPLPSPRCSCYKICPCWRINCIQTHTFDKLLSSFIVMYMLSHFEQIHCIVRKLHWFFSKSKLAAAAILDFIFKMFFYEGSYTVYWVSTFYCTVWWRLVIQMYGQEVFAGYLWYTLQWFCIGSMMLEMWKFQNHNQGCGHILYCSEFIPEHKDAYFMLVRPTFTILH